MYGDLSLMMKPILATMLGLLGLSAAASAQPAAVPACRTSDMPPRQEDWQFSVHQEALGNFSLFLSEAAEGFLGPEEFDALADRFAAVPGVTSVEHQDRESFLVQAPDLTANQVQALLWSAFVTATADACKRG